MIPRELGLSFQIDTNRINSRSKLPAMNRLEDFRKKGLIEILLSAPAQHEALANREPGRVAKAYSYIFSLDTFRGPEEIAKEEEIEQILFPGGARATSEHNDVRIVAHALKYHCILITADGGSKRQLGGILGHREELRQRVGVRVLTDEEAVSLVERRIQSRDEAARKSAFVTGERVPEWVGRD